MHPFQKQLLGRTANSNCTQTHLESNSTIRFPGDVIPKPQFNLNRLSLEKNSHKTKQLIKRFQDVKETNATNLSESRSLSGKTQWQPSDYRLRTRQDKSG